MQHIMQIAFDFDDDRVRKIAESTIEKEMALIVKNIVTDQIAPIEQTWHGNKERNWNKFNRKVEDEVHTFIEAHKDEIIQLAADKLADSYKRTKAWKEKVSETI